MRDLATAIDLIKKWEGFRAKAYLDPIGIPTIGYGTIRWPDGPPVKLGDTITEERASALLEKHIEKEILPKLNDALAFEINDNQYNALVSFAYNLGIGALVKSTLMRKLNQGNFEGASKEFDRWVYAGGTKLKGLVRRRSEERALFDLPVDQEIVEKKSLFRRFWSWLKGLFN